MSVDQQNVGNKNLISNDEAAMADFLRARNLAKTNANDRPVCAKNGFYVLYVKRLLDLLIGIPAFIVTLPFNIIFGICTYFDVGRPIFYCQTRTGKDCKPFVLVKFRNMNEKKDASGTLLPARERVTKFGRFMRKYSLDELLNFWSVVKGDMSIIGPRPLPEFFNERMSDRHRMRHAVRPGLECPRVYVPEGKNLCNYHRQFENDIWYVEHVSFLTDVKMCFKLFQMVFSFGARDQRATGNVTAYFVGYDDEGHALDMIVASDMYSNEEVKKYEGGNGA